MVLSFVSTKRVVKGILGVWVSSDISGTASLFSYNDVFAQAITDVGSLEYCGVLPPNEIQRLCSSYCGCVIHVHECLFSLVGYRLPFNGFEISVLNHLLIAHS